jgi:phosphoglycolate phosphatase-like HAD superfamily hydrolase
MSNTETVIFDLDDTLADTRSMRDGVARPIDEQMRRMSVAPALPLAQVARSYNAEGVRVIIMTARTDSDFTRAQVARYGITAEFLFRAEGDNRDDHKVKADHVRNLIAQGVNIVKAFDDKVKNCQMFASFGIEAIQA